MRLTEAGIPEAVRDFAARAGLNVPIEADNEYCLAKGLPVITWAMWEARMPQGRVCQNPRCRRGDGGGPGSLAHLRADAVYCNTTCKKAVQRRSNREK